LNIMETMRTCDILRYGRWQEELCIQKGSFLDAFLLGETSVVIRIMSVVALTGNHVPEGSDKSKPGVET
jgi:hypothetical protein